MLVSREPPLTEDRKTDVVENMPLPVRVPSRHPREKLQPLQKALSQIKRASKQASEEASNPSMLSPTRIPDGKQPQSSKPSYCVCQISSFTHSLGRHTENPHVCFNSVLSATIQVHSPPSVREPNERLLGKQRNHSMAIVQASNPIFRCFSPFSFFGCFSSLSFWAGGDQDEQRVRKEAIPLLALFVCAFRLWRA